jgi:hypothetical protein
MGCLYSLTFPSGKAYIGISSRDAETRFTGHVKHATTGRRNAVHRAILKYGRDNVVVRTIVVASDLAYLKDLEKKAIMLYCTVSPHGYNMTNGGEDSGFWCEETREKARKSQIVRWQRISAERKRSLTVSQIAAMRAATSDPAVESMRVSRIKETMRGPSSRIARGQDRPNAKMNPEKLKNVRYLIGSGISDYHIASQFGVSRELIRDIRLGKRWTKF